MLRLKNLREESNLTLRQLSQKLDISYSSLGKYEREEQQPSIDTLIKIAKFFGVSTDYLLGYSNYKNANEEYHFNQSLSLPNDEELYYSLKVILKSYSHLIKQYQECNMSCVSPHSLPSQMLYNLRIIANSYQNIKPLEAKSIHELSQQMGQITADITLGFKTLSLFSEIAELFVRSHQPPTTE